MGNKTADLVTECKRQVENCLYTSTAFFIWLRLLRYTRLFFVVTPLVLGSVASWKLLTQSDLQAVKLVVSLCAFFAGLLPTVYAALKFDDTLEHVKRAAADFKNLQDRFRQVAIISSKKSFADFEADFNAVMARMESARSPSLTTPEVIFRWAQRKVKSGDYTFDVDLETAGNEDAERQNSSS
ncbi:MAG: hypothetical protein KF841_02890 [Phycisphaerae bacterium]|nr:hypothetical protein [Phycisphaerae bacterium]